MRLSEFLGGAAASLLLILIPGCGSPSVSSETYGDSISSDVDQGLLSSAFIIHGLACQRKASGSGVLVEQGILTNAHVVAGTEDLYVIDHNGNEYQSRLVSIDSQTDLALLHVEGLNVHPLAVASPEKGMKGIALVGGDGLIKAIPATIDRLVEINIADIYGEGEYRRKGMQLNADIASGDSGGAIVNGSGEVVGLVFSRSSNRNNVSYAVSSEEFSLVTENLSFNGIDSGECLRK